MRDKNRQNNRSGNARSACRIFFYDAELTKGGEEFGKNHNAFFAGKNLMRYFRAEDRYITGRNGIFSVAVDAGTAAADHFDRRGQQRAAVAMLSAC